MCLIAQLVVACLGTLVGALAVFLRDVNLNLVALELETAVALRPVGPDRPVRARPRNASTPLT